MKYLSLSSPVVNNDISGIASSTSRSLSILADSVIGITGANGFLASNIIYYILKLSSIFNLNIRVIAFCRSYQSLLSRFSCSEFSTFSSYLQYIPYDSNYNFSDSPRVDYFIHAASNASPDLFANDPFGTCLSNTQGTINSLNFSVRSNCKNYLLFSTSGIYGINSPDSYPLTEQSYGSIDSLDKKNIYLLSKKTAECLVANASHLHSLNFNIIRPSIIYGPGLNLSDVRSFPYFLSSYLHDHDIILNSSGESYRNYLYISDFVVAVINLLTSPHNTAFNLASSIDTRIIDLAMKFSNLSSSKLKVILSQSNSLFDRVDFSRTSTSQSQLMDHFGWSESVSLDLGIQNSINHYSFLMTHE